jgi:hypothetical protein
MPGVFPPFQYIFPNFWNFLSELVSEVYGRTKWRVLLYTLAYTKLYSKDGFTAQKQVHIPSTLPNISRGQSYAGPGPMCQTEG